MRLRAISAEKKRIGIQAEEKPILIEPESGSVDLQEQLQEEIKYIIAVVKASSSSTPANNSAKMSPKNGEIY